MQQITAFNPNELSSQTALQAPSEKKEQKFESLEEQSIFVRGYLAGRKMLGMDKEVLTYDYSVLTKSKDSEEK